VVTSVGDTNGSVVTPTRRFSDPLALIHMVATSLSIKEDNFQEGRDAMGLELRPPSRSEDSSNGFRRQCDLVLRFSTLGPEGTGPTWRPEPRIIYLDQPGGDLDQKV
jgi:hypothetical protein